MQDGFSLFKVYKNNDIYPKSENSGLHWLYRCRKKVQRVQLLLLLFYSQVNNKAE